MKIESWLRKAAVISMLTTGGVVSTTYIVPELAVAASLSATEASDLTFQREEEKLARDVYLTLYDTWDARIFSNIATRAEQRHTDVMKMLLDKYLLPDPAQPGIGTFTNSALQSKYAELVAKGLVSYVEALYVGAFIEELDMVDLQHAIDNTTRVDLRTAYRNLMEGSKNHLRAFVSSLDLQGITYAPVLLSRELYDAIIGL